MKEKSRSNSFKNFWSCFWILAKIQWVNIWCLKFASFSQVLETISTGTKHEPTLIFFYLFPCLILDLHKTLKHIYTKSKQQYEYVRYSNRSTHRRKKSLAQRSSICKCTEKKLWSICINLTPSTQFLLIFC